MGAPKNNKYALGNKGGRPPAFKSVQDLQDAVNSYIQICDLSEGKKIANKAGFCVFAGIHRDTYRDYKVNKNEEFSCALKDLEAKIEEAWVQRLNSNAPTGAIFYLKNAFKEDYRDKVETEHSGELKISGVEITVRK